jgi:hypothetical protein
MGIFGEPDGFLGRYLGSSGADDGDDDAVGAVGEDDRFDLFILSVEAGKG